MAAREEIVRFVYQVTGDKELAATVAVMLKAGETADETSDEFKKFSKALSESADKIGLINKAISEKAGLSELSAKFDAAQAKARDLAEQLSSVAARSPQVFKALTKDAAANDKVIASLTAEYGKLQVSLAKTEGTLERSGVNTRNLASESTRLKQQANEAAVSLSGLGAGAKETSKGFEEIVTKSGLLSRVVDQVKALAAAFAGLFVLDKAKEAIEGVLEAGDRAAKFRQQFADAFGGIEAGAEALEKTRDIASRVPLALDDVQAAALRARQRGLDPFNGSLEKLIQTNARYGGSVDSLNGLIDTLGAAVARNEVSIRTLTQLQQQGVPAAELLGKALGKTASEIRDLASSGKLGGDAVRTLVDALAQSGAGEAGTQLNLLSTITIKLRDQWDDFLETIANSGAYDFVAGQLKKLSASIKTGLADGSLQKAAQSISDAIVGIGKAIVGTTQFLLDHATAIATLVRGYVIFKSAMLALDLASAAKKWSLFGDAAKAAAGSVGEAAATAEKAAAESGGFGKLRAAIGRIPKAIQIGLVVAGIDFAVGQLEKLVEVTQEYLRVREEGKQIDADIAANQQRNSARAIELAQRLQGFADVQVASAEELARNNKFQAQAYLEQLQNAIRYYTALRIQQQQQGDNDGAAKTTAHLKELVTGLRAAQAAYADLDVAIKRNIESVDPVVDRFDKLRTAGLSAAEAVKGAFRDIDVKTPAGLDSAIEILRQLSVRSREAGSAVKSELVESLKALDEQDLTNFRENVTAKLQDAKGAATELHEALGAALIASMQQLGLSAEQSGQDVSAAGEKIIATFRNIAENAEASGSQIRVSFAKALQSADTEGAVRELRSELESAFNAGKIGAEEFNQASLAAGRRLAEIKVAATEATAGLDTFGNAGLTSAQRVSGALQDVRDALIVQENQLSSQLTAALAANDATLAAHIKGQINAVGAEIDTYNQKIDTLAKSADIPAPKLPTQNFKEATQAAEQYATGVGDITFANKEAASAFEELGGSAGSMGPLLDILSTSYSSFASVSSAAVKKFSDTLLAFFNGNARLSQQAIADGTGIIRAGEAAVQAAQFVQRAIDTQRQGVSDFSAQLQNMTDAQLANLAQVRGGTDALAASLAGDAAAAREGRSAFDLLGAADLGPLQSALDATAARVRQIAEEAKNAREEIQNIASDLEDELDQINGNQRDIENRRFEKQIQQIKDAAKIAGTLNSTETQRALDLAEKVHKAHLRQIAEELAAQKKADDEAAANKNKNDSAGKPTDGGTDAAPNGPHALPGIQVNIQGSVIGSDKDSLAESLARLVQKPLEKILGRSL